jgi:hypothetical protein
MARQARIVIPGQAMHVLVRGNNRETLFFVPADYAIYLDWLRTAAAQFSVAVHAWTSYASHIGGKAEAWLQDHPRFWDLGNTPFERQMAWANWVKEGAPHWEDLAITEALLRSKPWVSPEYAKTLFKGNLDAMQIRPRGRPIKKRAPTIQLT